MKFGFTLLEMIIVMSVIVAIFLLTVPNIAKTLKVVDDKSCEAQLKIVDAAILQYRLKYDQNPSSIEVLVSEDFLSKEQLKCSSGERISISNGKATK